MSDKELGFKFVVENCIQCHGCEVACKSWRGVPLGVKWRRVENIWEGSFPKVTCKSVSVSCMHCADPACVAACPEEAISKRPEDGIVVVDRDACIACGMCFEACPFDVPQYGEDEVMQKCDMCVTERATDTDAPPCIATCPTEALALVKMDAAQKQTAETEMQALVDSAKDRSWEAQKVNG